jgi:predicted Zn-dependent protease
MIKRILLIFVILITLCSSVFADIQGKWFHPKFIRVYIQPDHYKGRLMTQAFREWSKLTKNKLVFQKVTSPKFADIEVEFVEKIDTTQSNTDRAIGLTRASTQSGKKLVHAKIWIAQKTQDDKVLSEDEVYTTMLHEIGHALGLHDSSRKLGIMSTPVTENQDIINTDLLRLFHLNGWTYIDKNTPAKLKEPISD